MAVQAGKIADETQRVQALEMASDLAVHAETMPEPKSQIETLMHAVTPGKGESGRPAGALRALTKQIERVLRDQMGSVKDRKLQRRGGGGHARVDRVCSRSFRMSPDGRVRGCFYSPFRFPPRQG